MVVVYLLDENYSQSYVCALLSLRSRLLHKPIHLRDCVQYLGRHRSLRLHLVDLDDVRRSFQSILNMWLSPPSAVYSGLRIHFGMGSKFIFFSGFLYSNGCLGDRILASYLSQLRSIR